MAESNWVEGFAGAITVCDRAGAILGMNARAAEAYRQDGGRALVGANVLDCHPEPARSKVAALLASGAANVYTIEKDGARKLVYQAPWYADGECRGLVELVLDLPASMPHFTRDEPGGATPPLRRSGASPAR